MYHPLILCGSHDLPCSGFSWMITEVPGSAIGILLNPPLAFGMLILGDCAGMVVEDLR